MTRAVLRATPEAGQRAHVTSEFDRWRAVRRSLAGVATTEFRPDVEGLRAIAVLAVVLFHARLGGFAGGFVGVDVFFVLSGFLITRLLLRELATTGTISLRAFWARRARRLLPASCLVIVVTVLAGAVLLPPLAQRNLGIDAIAAAGFVVNFVFANRFGDYFAAQAAETAPSPLLHFWSLAVEEQFYLVWPALLVVATRRPRHYRRLLIALIVTIAVASFVLAAWWTGVEPTWAFYLLPPRMGELLVGAALAAVGPAFRLVSARGRMAAGWLGLVGVMVAVTTYDAGTPFPGTATLLPVLCTALVLVAGGAGGHPSGPTAVLRARPLQWVGRHSYAIYLWHWPALVLIEARWGPLSVATRLGIVAASFLLAALSVKVLEDPVRTSRWLAAQPKRSLAMGAALCATGMAVGWIALTMARPLATDVVATTPVLAPVATQPPTPAVGPAVPAAVAAPPSTAVVAAAVAPTTVPSVLVGDDLASVLATSQQILAQSLAVEDVPANLRPSLGSAGGDRAQVYADGCVNIGVESEPKPCRYGDPAAATKVVLFGDSHAAQWSPPLIQLAEQQGFELVVLVKGGCPTAAVPIPTATLARTCPIWRDAAVELIAAEQPDLIVLSAWSGYPNSDEEWAAGLAETLPRLTPLAPQLVVLGDNPPARDNPAECLSANVRSASDCTATPDRVVAAGRIAVEQAAAATHGARFVNTTSWLCTPTGCPVIIGDILLFRDRTHLSTVATTWLAPLVDAAVLRPAG